MKSILIFLSLAILSFKTSDTKFKVEFDQDELGRAFQNLESCKTIIQASEVLGTVIPNDKALFILKTIDSLQQKFVATYKTTMAVPQTSGQPDIKIKNPADSSKTNKKPK